MADVTLAPWKLRFSPNGNGPYAVLVRLIDLFRYQSGDDWLAYPSGVGLKLPHDIVAFDPTLYSEEGVLKADADLDLRKRFAIYLCKTQPDLRKPLSLYSDPVYPNGGFYYTSDTSSFLPPQESDFINPLFTYNANAGDYKTSISVARETEPSSSKLLAMLKPDLILQTSLTSVSKIAYTQCKLPVTNSDELKVFIEFFTSWNKGEGGEVLVPSLVGEDYTDPSINPALLYTYIWVRCSFLADYVEPGVFEQDLTQTSNVRHKNLIVGTGDFSRFGREVVGSEVEPYLPVTPPRIDLFGSLEESQKGEFLIPAVTGTYATPGSSARIPYGWYSPELTLQSIPQVGSTKIPFEGNAYINGRIFSPSVDELWSYVKTLVDGRPADDSSDYSSADPQLAAGPKATVSSKLNIDTRLPPEPALNLPSNKVGDPLNKEGTTYVNASGGIKYAVNASIKYLANRITGATTNNTTNIVIDDNAYRPFVTHSTTDEALSSHGARVDPSVIQTAETAGHWGPRPNPYSVRELEAQIKNLQYNQELMMNFIMANKVSTGNTSLNDLNVQGSLYQLHVSYNPNLDNVDTGNSKWIAYTDTERPSDTATTYGNELPGTTSSYNRLTNISQQDVYLSAEGKWRYLFDHVRVPVLDETY